MRFSEGEVRERERGRVVDHSAGLCPLLLVLDVMHDPESNVDLTDEETARELETVDSGSTRLMFSQTPQ